ncbi:MAG: aminopeptidase [Candidatus Thermoplasmatota archaeon]|jgi:aspartyl aminopeptidase|nr:aminopeptidase [Candidatus Thermoplasmatota archaeon]
MAKDEKGSAKEKKLSMKRRSIWETATKAQKGAIESISKDYMDFIGKAKTERLTVRELISGLKKAGFKDIAQQKTWRAGAKVYMVNRDKSLAAAVLGKEPIEDGANLIASHGDSPRLDLKQNPLFEDADTKLALLKTHYYGGIRKYHWVNIPLAIHGTVVLGNGKVVEVHIGEDPADPVFLITDLLPHLSKKQGERKLSEGIQGEELQVLLASLPFTDKKASKKVKLWVLDHLHRKYGMVEEDFVSSEFEITPAGPAREVGFDRSMIGAYGQDDRICAFTSVKALMDTASPRRTSICLVMDKEEIGSEGPTSMRSRFMEEFYSRLLELKDRDYPDRKLMESLSRTYAISSDVNGAVDPIFKQVHELQNAARLGHGICITKYTGSGGKYNANDASAEFMGLIRKVLNDAKVPWQTGELGKVDEGGGGTIAKFLAEHNMDVVDAGPALISMHSPMELSSKADVWATYRAYAAFFAS